MRDAALEVLAQRNSVDAQPMLARSSRDLRFGLVESEPEDSDERANSG